MKILIAALPYLIPAVLGSSLRHQKDLNEAVCNAAKDRDSCVDLADADGAPCVWCRCEAIPSECLTKEQAKQVPEGVFDCSSEFVGPSSSAYPLSFMELSEKALPASDFCDAKGKTGYVAIPESEYDKSGENKHLFYWMYEKRSGSMDDKTIPFVVWLTGGPGCSSSLALLVENGPCKVDKDGMTTTLNAYSWTEAAHVLWLDQPAGVGFSYGKATDSNEKMISEDVYWFLQKFFDTHPEYSENPLFIFGESYGGHYAPAVAHRVNTYNKALPSKDAKVLPLAGLGVGNGLTDPEEQYKWYSEMAFHNSHGIKTISEATYKGMTEVVPKCTAMIHQCNKGDSFINDFVCQSAFTICNGGLVTPYQMTGLNPYDIRKPCGSAALCYDFSNVDKFMNLKETREALSVSSKSPKWESCNFGVNMKFHVDWMKDFSHYVADLLNDRIRVLIYAGDVDFICNYMGNKAWTYSLEWDGGDAFRSATEHPWKESGSAKTAQGLTFLQVFDAGHMVPMDQPEVALDMLQTFLNGEEF